MEHLHAAAAAQSITVLTSDVSRTAQPFFERWGFAVAEQRAPVIRGVVVPNAFMCKALASSPMGRAAFGLRPQAAGHAPR